MTTDFEVVTAAGRTVFTSSDETLARLWLATRKAMLPGCVVECVERIERRTVVYRPRPVTERQGATVTQLRRKA